jgi:hypothetical protein
MGLSSTIRQLPSGWRRETIVGPIEGRDRVMRVMGTASGIYDSLLFTHERAAAGGPTWNGKPPRSADPSSEA